MRWVRWFQEIDQDAAPSVGAKNAALGEVARHLAPAGVRVPDGFALVIEAYREFVRSNGLAEPLREALSGLAVAGLQEIARRSGDFALAGVVAAVEVDDAGAVSRSAIAFLGMAPTPVRARSAEEALNGSSPGAGELAEIGRLAVDDTEPTADVHASAEYRRHVGAHLVARARHLPVARRSRTRPRV